MAVASIKSLLSKATLASADQFGLGRREWSAEPESEGKARTLLAHVQRRLELPEEVFLQRLASVLGWPYLERVSIPQEEDAKRELRRRLSPKTVQGSTHVFLYSRWFPRWPCSGRDRYGFLHRPAQTRARRVSRPRMDAPGDLFLKRVVSRRSRAALPGLAMASVNQLTRSPVPARLPASLGRGLDRIVLSHCPREYIG